jgi:hypothetical protein
MGTVEAKGERLAVLLAADAAGELENYLLTNSGLPGPRGNLELAHALADLLARKPPGPAVQAGLTAWRALTAEEAPTGDPREYLCFCGTLAWSADWVRGPGGGQGGGRGRTQITRALRQAAGDQRWRRREAVAMALQRIGEADQAALLALLASWLEGGSFLELRAVVAALAHPPLLSDAAFARQALTLADRIMERVAAPARRKSGLAPAARREEDFRVLRQGLGYALSVLAAAEPERGFALLERWAASRDPDVAWILRENLKKKRLAAHAGRVARLSAALGGP